MTKKTKDRRLHEIVSLASQQASKDLVHLEKYVNRNEPLEVDPLEELQKDRSKRRSRRRDYERYDSKEIPPRRKRKGHRGDYYYDDNEYFEDD